MFDLLIQNNASKKLYLYRGLSNSSDDNLYIEFSNFELTNGEPDGEYTYFLIWNGRDDVVYELSEIPLETILHTEIGDVKLADLRPMTGLLKIGNTAEQNVSRKNNEKTEHLYR